MPAPKGNKFALFNKGGAPPIYKDVQILIDKIDEYFESFKSDGSEQFTPPLGFRPTVAGLALYLGFESRQSIYDYRDRNQEFSYIIKRALTYIEMHYEQMLESKSVAGAIFALKNMGWKDNLDVTTGGDKLTDKPQINLTINDKDINLSS